MPVVEETPVLGMAGCGAMGLPMAERLRDAGFEVWGFDIRPVSEFGSFTRRMIADPAEFAARVDCVFSVVRNRRQTMDLCFDQQAVFSVECPPETLVLCSTLSPRVVPEVAARLPAGTDLLDAPMSGAPHRARNGTLTFMVGGETVSVAALARLFEAMGERIHHLGKRGAGMTVKVINNFVVSSSVVAVRRLQRIEEGSHVFFENPHGVFRIVPLAGPIDIIEMIPVPGAARTGSHHLEQDPSVDAERFAGLQGPADGNDAGRYDEVVDHLDRHAGAPLAEMVNAFPHGFEETGQGGDGRILLEVMRTSSGGTWYGDHFDDIDWAREGYDPENTMGILEKDMTSFLDALQSADGMAAGPFEDAVLQSIRRTEPVNP